MSSGKPVSGSLSSRVMNMKFMRFASKDNENDSGTDHNESRASSSNSRESSVVSETSTAHHLDNSAWSLSAGGASVSNSESSHNNQRKKVLKLVNRASQMPRRRVVNSSSGDSLSITNIKRAEMSLKGRTTFGAPLKSEGESLENPKKRSLEENDDAGEAKDTSGADDGYDLDKIFKETMQRKPSDKKKKKKTKKMRKN